ncbi:MAG: glycosyltransferase [Alphaproteobacteria bacterium]|nr:glycosyltransferase [Alphaproteobacteria bacterium]MBP9878152.1 glycosyltransferase [Alphaproteobacteria bacterium]
MKIVHIFDHSLPLYSGYSFRSKNILLAQKAENISTVAVTSMKHNMSTGVMSPPESEKADDLTFHRCRTRFPFLYKTPLLSNIFIMVNLFFKLRQLVKTEKPDLIHAHSPFLNLAPAVLIKHLYKIPVCYEIRAFWEDAAVDHGTLTENSFLYTCYQKIETYLIQFADIIFPISQGLKDDLIARKIPESKIQIIPNAVSMTELLEAHAPKKTQIDHITFGFIGSFYAYEGLDIALYAFQKFLTETNHNATLILAGGGPEEHRMKDLCRFLKLENNVQFLGKVPNAEVNNIYKKIDIMIFPRKKMRLTDLVTPLKPLEAMLYDKIVVASDVGGHQELIVNAKTGYLFKADDIDNFVVTLHQVIAEQASWKNIYKNGRTFLETERNWKINGALYKHCYLSFTT